MAAAIIAGLVTTPMAAFCTLLQGASCVCSTINVLSCLFQPAMGRKHGVTPQGAKMFYILLFGVLTMMSMILRFNSEKFSFGVFKHPDCGSDYKHCKGDLAVYRISFILVLFFTLMMGASIASEAVHRGYWGIKILAILVGIIGSFWIPDDSFNVHAYAWFSRVGSVCFLVLQILILIDFAYQWNDSWVAKAYGGDNGALEVQNNNWVIAILAMAGVLFASSLTGLVLLYTFYSKCPVGVSFTTLALLGVILMTVLSVFRDKIVGNEMQGAVLPTAIVVAYSIFLTWSALEANPDAQCLPMFEHKSLDMTFGTLFATVTLMWSAFSVTSNAAHLMKGETLVKAGENTESEVLGGPVVSAGDLEENMLDDNESDDLPLYTNEPSWVFHLIMISASMYQAMLLTDWGTSQGPANAGEASMWMKIVAQWLTVLLFSWTMVAPAILKNRDFDF